MCKIIIGYQKTSIDGDFLIIHKLQFDPTKARNLGIPVGPLYGVLGSGQSVEVNGRVITPPMVHTECTKILHIPGLERYV
jgi:D-aminoacyl-tRNA deacylase